MSDQTREQPTGDAIEAYGYLSRLFLSLAPQCVALPTLTGLATQLDNYIAGQQEDLASARQRQRELEQRERTFQVLLSDVLDRCSTRCACKWCQNAKGVRAALARQDGPQETPGEQPWNERDHP